MTSNIGTLSEEERSLVLYLRNANESQMDELINKTDDESVIDILRKIQLNK